MPTVVGPPPVHEPISNDEGRLRPAWNAWFWRLLESLGGAQAGTWSGIDLTGSDLNDLVTKNHNDLDTFQGGTTNEYYHLTSAQHSEATTFFANTDMTGAEAETLTDGSNADSLHTHAYNDMLNVDTAEVGNVGVGEDDLITYTLPANTLSAAGIGIRITAWGTGANNAATKTLKTYFGSTVVATDSLTASQVDNWKVVATVWSTGTDTQDYESEFLQSGTVSQIILEEGTAAEDDGATITIKCTGEATSDNDIVQKGLTVELLT